MPKKHYSLRQAAQELNITRQTLYRWIERGVIQAIQPAGRGSNWRIPISEIRRLQGEGLERDASIEEERES